MLDALRTADIDHYIAFESESSAEVRSAVAFPTASFVVRVNSRSRTTAVRTLVDEIRNTLH